MSWLRTMTLSSFIMRGLVLLLLSTLLITGTDGNPVVNAAASVYQCDGTCEETFESPCAKVIEDYNFQGDCCALEDYPDATNRLTLEYDCKLTVAHGECVISSRRIPCQLRQGSSSRTMTSWSYSCADQQVTAYESNITTTDCPVTDYTLSLYNSSQQGVTNNWELQLEGLSRQGQGPIAIEYETVEAWMGVLQEHTVHYSRRQNVPYPLDIRHVETYILPHMAVNTTIAPDGDGILRVRFFQFVTWRNVNNNDNNGSHAHKTVDRILEQVYWAPEAQGRILKKLQAVTPNIRVISILPPPARPGVPSSTSTSSEQDSSGNHDGDSTTSTASSGTQEATVEVVPSSPAPEDSQSSSEPLPEATDGFNAQQQSSSSSGGAASSLSWTSLMGSVVVVLLHVHLALL